MKHATSSFYVSGRNKFSLFFKYSSILLLVLLVSGKSLGQTTIASQDFESTPATPTMTFTNTGSGGTFGTSSGTTSASADKPASANYFSGGSQGYKLVGTSSGTATRTMKFSSVNTSSYTGVSFSLRLASFSVGSTANGADGSDIVSVDVSPDNGVTWYTRVEVLGKSNARWSFSTGIGNASNTYAANNTSKSTYTATSGDASTSGYSTITINSLPSVSQLVIRVNLTNDDTKEVWVIDDAKITGTPAVDAPVVTASQSYTPTVGVAFSQQIEASNSPTSYAVSSGSLPTGLSMSTGGVVSGTPTAAGTFTPSITATNGAGTSPAVDVAFTVAKGSQSITFGSLPAKTTADADFSPGATSSTSGINAISYSSSNTAVATIASNQIHIVGAGTTTITASQAGNSDYNAATSVDQALTVTQFVTPQSITFGALSTKTYGDTNFDLTATASSGLTVSYSSSNTAVATISGSTVTIVGPGTTTITASQAGNSEYNPATSVNQDLVVNVKPLTVTNAAVTTKTYDGTTAAVITGTLTGIVGADVVTLTGTGTFADANANTGISVTSTSTLGGANAVKYSLTQPTGMTGDINKASQTITLASTATKHVGDASYTLAATSTTSAINALSYSSSNTGVATIDPTTGLVTIISNGTTTLTVSQGGSTNYNAASDVSQILTVSTAPIAILGWQFGSPASAGDESTYKATTNNSNLNTSTLTRGSGIVATALARGFSANTWDATTKVDAVNNGEYYQFTLNTKAGYKTSLSTLDARLRRTSTAPNAYIWKYSTDGTNFNEIGTDVSFTSTSDGVTQSQIDLTGISALQNVTNATSLTFRLYAWGGTAQTATFAIARYGSSVTTNCLEIGGVITQIYNIATSSSDLTKGSVTGDGIKDAGSSVLLTATPSSGSYRFVNWTDGSGNFVSVANPYSFTASEDKTLIANFADFTTTISSTVNASTVADCATCNVTVASTGALTIDASKTYNSITVAPGGKVTVNDGKTLTAPVTLLSDSTGTASFVNYNISSSVTGTVQQYLTGTSSTVVPRGWWYVASPISNAKADVFIPNGSSNKFGYWDEPSFGYPQITDNQTALTQGKGYVFNNNSADGIISFNGTLNNGNIRIQTTRTGTTDGARGFNLIGNPYPSYIDWSTVTKNNVRQTIWYRTWAKGGGGMTFDTFDGTVGTANGKRGAVSQYIPPMQGFWVKVNADADTASVIFHNSDRLHREQTAQTNRLRVPGESIMTPAIIRLSVSNGTNSDEVILVGDVNASNAFDNYDSPKMKVNNSEIPELYSIADQQELVINHLNSITNNTELPLGFRPGKTASFTISATEISNVDSNLKVILKDNNTEYELSNGNSYSFSSDATATNNRFSILFKSNGAVTSTENKKVNNVIVSSSNNEISIITDGDSNNNAKATVYNSIGKEVKTLNLKPGVNRLSSISTGVYIVQINTNKSTSEHKVVIK